MVSLGIDIGYSSIKFVLIDQNLKILEHAYTFHKGRVKEQTLHYIKQLKQKYGDGIAFGGITGQGGKFIVQGITWINEVPALLEGSKNANTNHQSIIEIGGQSAKYITNISTNSDQNILIAMNSNCSAGTGSFIEEQASRLGILLEDFSNLALKASFIPRIAGRCSVFAKTDIIHHQQDGIDTANILLGLAYALVKNYRGNVMKKHPLKLPVLLAGGVARNKAVVKAILDVLKLNDQDILVPEHCGNLAALGAAIIGLKECRSVDIAKIIEALEAPETNRNPLQDEVILKPLHPFGSKDSINKHPCKKVEAQAHIRGYIGLDVGSTSTNIVLMDDEHEVLAYQYLKTLGDPIAAVRKGLNEIRREFHNDIQILGVGATGSGRYLAGRYVGADVIRDEITAQAKAACFLNDEVDTIIEIGGQDSKFIRLENGTVTDFEMNKICAAGTGSFLEEQAKKLNIPVTEFGELALKGQSPVDLGDRCTVFIETNIAASLGNQDPLEDIAAGLSYAIAKNYLNKVVAKKQIGKKVFFQGGVAYNQGVVNAFRAILGDVLEVPPFFSVTGAYGAAILAKEESKHTLSAFKGFDPGEALCQNEVKNTPVENPASKVFEEIERYYLEGYTGQISPSKKTVGIPRVLFLHKLFPLFNTYFKALGFNVILSGRSNDKTVELSQQYSLDETCYPVKLIHGHVAELIEKKVEYIFLPSLHTMAHPLSKTRQNYGCVYMQCAPKLIEKTMDLKSQGIQLLSPVLSFKFGKKYMMNTLLQLGEALGKNSFQTAAALAKGMKSLKSFEEKVEALGEETIRGLKPDEIAFVIITRSYGIVDPVLNMGIPQMLETMGYKVFTLSHLPAYTHDTAKEYPNMYWPFGQHILAGAQILRMHPNLYPIYITNHGCGPDTALTHLFKEEIKGKPYLNIEVDEHFSNVGVRTRLEAFINSLRPKKGKQNEILSLKQYSENTVHKTVNIKTDLLHIDGATVLYLPFIYPYSHMLAAYLKTKGVKADVLPMTTRKTLDWGRKCTLSKEYLSFTALAGDVLDKAYTAKDTNEKFGFVLPTCEGSEVDGQYPRLLRNKLDDVGLSNVEILSPFVEDAILDSALAEEIFLILLAGDLVNTAVRSKREGYLHDILKQIENHQFTHHSLIQISQEIERQNGTFDHSKAIVVLGEVSILYNDFMNNNTFKNLEEQGVFLHYQPLGEYMWFLWKDYLDQTGNKKAALAHETLNKLSSLMRTISKTLVKQSPFEENLHTLAVRADKTLGFFAGANGRYRFAKCLGSLSKAQGIITASSMYENTNTILNLLYSDNAGATNLPVLNMTFDGNENTLDQSKLDAFIYYTLQQKTPDTDHNQRGSLN